MNYLIMEQEKEMTLGVSIALDALKYKLGRVLNESSAGFKIRKVPEHLRTENVKAYEPQIIAIGPLNHYLPREKTHLAEMQRHKVLYLEKLLQRRGEDLSNLTRYCFTMGNSEERALCYLWDDDDNVLRTSWVRKKLARDLLLVENQLPLFVLQEFYDITKMPEDRETKFQDLILGFFKVDTKNNHLLGFIWDYYWEWALRFPPPAYDENWNFITSAINLREAGIKIERVEGESLLSIDFDKDAGY
ncbi:hypothetical protein CISIN_1g045726mg [Citrus sinensis]|uniref:Uncharacterized protein n=1 Tax=Citrus sinensis TaxID=2711 RepID=A0A067DCH1_CITSI|nr:hypothetical protein CISIN_1g045726mg [Citrus sinensis]